MTPEQLDLEPAFLPVALKVAALHPQAVFTSGRRGVRGQALAMAANVTHNRRWIAQTYRDTPSSRALQAWVDAHSQVELVDDLADGFAGVMAGWTDAQRRDLSRHFSGEAFDVQPRFDTVGRAILATLRALPGVKFLEKEGGLDRWHVQSL